MLGYIYLILAVGLGFVICSFAFPEISSWTKTTFKGNTINASSIFALIPAWFTTGILVLTWMSYIFACIFRNSTMPLLYADEFVMLSVIPVIIAGLFVFLRGGRRFIRGEWKYVNIAEKIVFAAIILLFLCLFFVTFRIAHNQLYIGLSVFSDFTPHVSMVRSFSYMQNFPTQYSVCAGGDVRYHFMFEFLIGNLEYLGMRLDRAFNIPSLLSIISMYSLFYVLALRISGKRSAGLLACGLLTFRSSSALFDYIAGLPKGTNILKALKTNIDFIGSTNHEDWGLWNLNVYCNQRHFALGISVLLFILLLFIPRLYSSFERMEADAKGIKSYIFKSLLAREGWLTDNFKMPVAAGIILGALGFFNGAVLIATVIVLFFIAAVSDRRLEFLITAALAGILSLIQTKVFVDGSVFSTLYYYGFLSDNGTLFSSIDYISKLLGILPLLLLIVFIVSKGVRKYLMFAFSMPIIMAFTVSLTPDIAVNHKYIMIAVMLLDIFAAAFIISLLGSKNKLMRVLSVILALCLTATGVYDTYIVFRRNNPKYSIVNNTKDELMVWIADNCTAKDLFLTSNYYLMNNSSASQIIMSGAMLYDGWQYFAWSAGYDTSARDKVVRSIYSCTDSDRLSELLSENNIDYVVIDYYNRHSEDYVLNEQIFEDNLKVAYTKGTGDTKVTIYKYR